MATSMVGQFSDMTLPGEHESGHPDAGQKFYILFIDTVQRGKVQVYLPYSGHKHFSITNSLATLFNAIHSCQGLITAANNGVEYQKNWSATYESMGVTFLCAQSKDLGECIKIFHSESKKVYKDHKFVAMNREEKKYNPADYDF